MVFILYKLYVLLPYTNPTPKLSPHRRRCISTFTQKNSLCMIYKHFKYGDTENVLINHLLLVIPMLYPCHYTNVCPHKPHKHAHTHTHTRTQTHTHTHIYIIWIHMFSILIICFGLSIMTSYHIFFYLLYLHVVSCFCILWRYKQGDPYVLGSSLLSCKVTKGGKMYNSITGLYNSLT